MLEAWGWRLGYDSSLIKSLFVECLNGHACLLTSLQQCVMQRGCSTQTEIEIAQEGSFENSLQALTLEEWMGGR